MKILLAACNAKYIHSNLAVYDLKAYSSDYDEHVILREYTINQPKDGLKSPKPATSWTVPRPLQANMAMSQNLSSMKKP